MAIRPDHRIANDGADPVVHSLRAMELKLATADERIDSLRKELLGCLLDLIEADAERSTIYRAAQKIRESEGWS